MASKFQAPRGTFDVLPDAARNRGVIERRAAEVLTRAGYQPIATPIYEDTDLFVRGVGRSTDIVQKEMFTFEDKGGRSLTLRPEGTAPICRAYLAHGMHKLAQPVKLSYGGPFFRHERPQAGRYRQFHQLGVESIGSDSPLADAEVILLFAELIASLGVPGVTLRLGSLGSASARRTYLERLSEYLLSNKDSLPENVRERIHINPLRAFDSSHEGTKEVMAGAPQLLEHLSPEDEKHFEEVRELLGAAGLDYEIDPTLVRGIDYYSRTIFSFVCDRLGAQSEVGGGGRYDGLVEQLGGPPTPAIGWAMGIERLLLALDRGIEEKADTDLFVAAVETRQRQQALVVADEARRAGLSAEIDLGGRNLKGQLRHADRIGSHWVLILDAGGTAELRDMWRRSQTPVDYRRVVEILKEESDV